MSRTLAIACGLAVYSVAFGQLLTQQAAAQTADSAAAEGALVAEKPADDGLSINAAELPEGLDRPFHGLTVKEHDERGLPQAVEVVAGTRPYEAGLRADDLLIAVGDVEDVTYREFLDGIDRLAEETYEGDTIPIVYERDGERYEARLPGVGRSPEAMHELQERSERKIEEQLGNNDGVIDPLPDREVTTEQLERYVRLKQQSLANGAFDATARRELAGLESTLVASGYLGGLYSNGYARSGRPAGLNGVQPSNGTERVADGAFEDTRPAGLGGAPEVEGQSPRPTSPVTQRLNRELKQLAGVANSGELDPAQTRRLEALQGVSRFIRSSQNAAPANENASVGAMGSPSNSGMNPAQQRRLQQIQQRRQSALGQPGANRNQPASGANSASNQKPETPTGAGTGIGEAGPAATPGS